MTGLKSTIVMFAIVALFCVTLSVSIPSVPLPKSSNKTINVGPNRAIKTINAAVSKAGNGDLVLIDQGDYIKDVASWPQTDLTIRGVGNVRLISPGYAAETKGIFVIQNGNFLIDNIQFYNCSISQADGNNGAGIRFEGGNLTITNSVFNYNQDGILTNAGTNMGINITNSSFGWNGAGDGYSHNIYVGQIGVFQATGCWFHDAAVGHLVKTRAQNTILTYNRITGESGTESYEVDLPNGGNALLLGNLIEQAPNTENPIIISYGEEGYVWSTNQLVLSYNTIVDHRPTPGTFLVVASGGTVTAVNNILVNGNPSTFYVTGGKYTDNANSTDAKFTKAATFNYLPLSTAPFKGKFASTPSVETPVYEYVHVAHTTKISHIVFPGAFQQASTSTAA